MKVIEHINQAKETLISFEIFALLYIKGNFVYNSTAAVNLYKVFGVNG